jgi:hypothetical protein
MAEYNVPQLINRQDILPTVASYVPIEEGYIADLIYPPFSVFQTGGKKAFQKYQGDGAANSATTGRAAGAAITYSNNLTNLVTFSCSERLAAPAIDVSEVEQYGGPQGVDIALGAAGIRQIAASVETDVNTAVAAWTAKDATTGSNLLLNLRSYVATLKAYGKVAVFGGANAWNTVRNDSVVRDGMKNTGSPIIPLSEVRFLGQATLAATLGCDAVWEANGLAGSLWPTDHIGACVIADKPYDPMWMPQVGRRLVYTWTSAGVNETMTVQQTYIPTTRQIAFNFVVKDNLISANCGGNGTDAGYYIKIA